jgi:hypothetical protein
VVWCGVCGCERREEREGSNVCPFLFFLLLTLSSVFVSRNFFLSN